METKIPPEDMKRKRYIIFGYPQYYPSGGLGDELDERANTLEECKEIIGVHKSKYSYNSYDVLDMDTGEWIEL